MWKAVVFRWNKYVLCLDSLSVCPDSCVDHVLIAPESTSRNREIPPRWDIELF